MTTFNLLISFETDGALKKIIEGNAKGAYGIAYLNDAKDRRLAIERADAVLSWNPPREFSVDEYAMLKNAKFMQLVSAGGDHVPFKLLPRAVEVAGNVGAFSIPMAEHVMAMALSLLKNLREGHDKLKAGNFDQSTPGRQLCGMTCAIIGFGGIGKAVAALMRPFGVKISAINSSGATREEVDLIGTTKDLEKVLGAADIIVISVPLSRMTKGMIGEEQFSWMKNDAVLINVARGEIIDEKALYEHLKARPGFKAGIDAWWVEPFRHGKFEVHYPFLEMPNVLGSPHNSAMVAGAMPGVIKAAMDNIEDHFTGKKVKGIFKREDYFL